MPATTVPPAPTPRQDSDEESFFTNGLTPSEAARLYVARGLRIVPVPLGSKAPTITGWQSLVIGTGDVESFFSTSEPLNIGILTGEYADVDLDCQEAVGLAKSFLPATDAIFGRASKARSHYIYRVEGLRPTVQFRDASGNMLVELRGKDCQTIFPPSIHPSGERIVWHTTGRPASAEWESLLQRVSWLAAAALLARHWPLQGARQKAALALAGGLLRDGAPANRVAVVIEAVASLAGDEEATKRADTVRSTAARLQARESATGWRNLTELIGKKPVELVRRWTRGSVSGSTEDATAPDDQTQPTITLRPQQLPEIVAEVWKVLVDRSGREGGLFRSGSQLVLLTDTPEPATIQPVTGPLLKAVACRSARWLRQTDEGSIAAQPPQEVIADMLAMPSVELPELTSVRTTPLISASGDLLGTHGYHAGDRVFLDLRRTPGVEVPAAPTSEDIADAVATLRGLIEDFGLDPAGFAHAIAAMLTPLVRCLIAGPTPLHLIESAGPGTGKGLLATVITIVAQGEAAAAVPLPSSESEVAKLILSQLLAGAPVTWFDNADSRFAIRSSTLCGVLTAPSTWGGRILGRSAVVEVPVTTSWLLSAINPTLSDEMARRTVRIRLPSKEERPWLRRGFRHPRLARWARDNRGALLQAALTMVRGWVVAGRPEFQGRTLGSFEEWSAVLGGILDNAGIPGFLSDLSAHYAAVDQDRAMWLDFVTLWWATWGDQPIRPNQLAVIAGEQDLLATVMGDGSPQSRSTKLGQALSRKRESVIGSYRILPAKSPNSRIQSSFYRLERVDTKDGGVDA